MPEEVAVEIRYGAVLGPVGRLIEQILDRYPKRGELYITSGYRPTETGSNHSGLTYNNSPTAAVDVGARDYGVAEGDRRMRDLARWLEQFTPLIVELIHTTPYADDNGFYVKNGRRYEGYSEQTKADHLDHVHFALSEAQARQILAQLTPPPAPPPSEPFLIGWDASDFDDARGMRAEHIRTAYAEGIRFFTHKVSEHGTGGVTIHHQYGPKVTAARDAGIPFLGAYVVARSKVPVGVQADTALAQVQAGTPWFRDHPGWFWQIDCEKWSYDQVPASVGEELAAELERRTGKRAILYASRGQYGDSIPGTRPLWNADYRGSGDPGHWWDQWQRRKGFAGEGWGPYSGRAPRIVQFASDCTIGGQPTCDVNAFRGTEADFHAMLATIPTPPEEDDMPTAQEIAKAVWETPLDGDPYSQHWLVTAAKQADAAAKATEGIQAQLAALATAVGQIEGVDADQLQQIMQAVTAAAHDGAEAGARDVAEDVVADALDAAADAARNRD